MCQNQKTTLAKINDQIQYVLQLTKDVQHNLLSSHKSTRFDPFVFIQLEKFTNFLSTIPYLNDQETDSSEFSSSLEDDFQRKTLFQIIGNGQIKENNLSVKMEQSCLSQLESNSKINSIIKQSSIRGPYRSYQTHEKLRVIKLYQSGKTFAYISRCLGIPQKNVVRWCRNGVIRKQGAGRKIGDPEMEKNILKWIRQSFCNGDQVKTRQIREKAFEYSTKVQFKSSKGWLKNFIRRYALNKIYEIV